MPFYKDNWKLVRVSEEQSYMDNTKTEHEQRAEDGSKSARTNRQRLVAAVGESRQAEASQITMLLTLLKSLDSGRVAPAEQSQLWGTMEKASGIRQGDDTQITVFFPIDVDHRYDTKTFTVFPNLPTELRRMIWRYAALSDDREHYLVSMDPYNKIEPVPLPSVLHANKESRGEAVKIFQIFTCTVSAQKTTLLWVDAHPVACPTKNKYMAINPALDFLSLEVDNLVNLYGYFPFTFKSLEHLNTWDACPQNPIQRATWVDCFEELHVDFSATNWNNQSLYLTNNLGHRKTEHLLKVHTRLRAKGARECCVFPRLRSLKRVQLRGMKKDPYLDWPKLRDYIIRILETHESQFLTGERPKIAGFSHDGTCLDVKEGEDEGKVVWH